MKYKELLTRKRIVFGSLTAVLLISFLALTLHSVSLNNEINQLRRRLGDYQNGVAIEFTRSSCEYQDEEYEHGDEFPAEDGCNICVCGNGEVSCTKMYCEQSDDIDDVEDTEGTPTVSIITKPESFEGKYYLSTDLTCSWENVDNSTVQPYVYVNGRATSRYTRVAENQIKFTASNSGTYTCAINTGNAEYKSEQLSVELAKISLLSAAISPSFDPNPDVVGRVWGELGGDNILGLKLEVCFKRTVNGAVQYFNESASDWSTNRSCVEIVVGSNPGGWEYNGMAQVDLDEVQGNDFRVEITATSTFSGIEVYSKDLQVYIN